MVPGSMIEFDKAIVARGPDKVLDGLDLCVHRGEILCLFGPSGCGKTTALLCVLGDLIPVSGSVMIEGGSACEFSEPIAYAPQNNELCAWKSVEGNVRLWERESRARSPKEHGMAVEEAIELVRLDRDREKFPAELSGGMARRTVLARCLATHSRVMLLDEGFSGIERHLRRGLMEAVRRHIKTRGITAVVVSHDYEEAIFLSDRIARITVAPTRVESVHEVPLPPDRNQKAFDAPEFTKAILSVLPGRHDTELR